MGLNEVLRYIFIGLTVTVICSVSSAITVDGSLITMPKGDYSYEGVLDHKEEVVYEQSGANVPVKQNINEKEELKNLNNVPGKTINGYSKLIIKKIDEKTVLVEGDKEEYLHGSEMVDLKFQVKGNIAKGTWTDLINDRPIRIELTPEAAPAIKSKLKTYLEKVIKTMANKALVELSESKKKGMAGVKDRMMAKAVGNFTRVVISNDNLVLKIVALEGTKKHLKQSFSLDTKFKLHNN